MPETPAPSSPAPGSDPSPVDPLVAVHQADDAPTDVVVSGAVDPGAVVPGVVDPGVVDPGAAPAPRARHRRALSARGVAIRRVTRAVGPTALVAATLVACTTASGPPAPPTVRVERTSVSTAVSSSGSLTAVTEQNLGFLKGGQLKTVEVAVGQKVAEGDVLATVDDIALRRVLEQQQGQLASQQAALNRLVNATTVAGAENTTDQAGEIVDATEGQTDATVDGRQGRGGPRGEAARLRRGRPRRRRRPARPGRGRLRGVRGHSVERVGRHLRPALVGAR